MVPRNHERFRVLRVNGVLRFVGSQGLAIPIQDEQIQAVQLLLEKQLPYCSHPFLKIGQRVRIRSGALRGVEGILVARSGERTLVVSLNAIQRSLSVRIEGYDVEPI
jgi:transcription antitermination factor NusG